MRILWQRRPLIKDNLWLKTTFEGRQALTEADLCRKTTFHGKWHFTIQIFMVIYWLQFFCRYIILTKVLTLLKLIYLRCFIDMLIIFTIDDWKTLVIFCKYLRNQCSYLYEISKLCWLDINACPCPDLCLMCTCECTDLYTNFVASPWLSN